LESYCTDIIEQLKQAAQRQGLREALGKKNLSSEHYCLYFALELCAPWNIRRHTPAHESNTFPAIEVAKFYKIPEAIIEYARISGYFEESREINLHLDQHGDQVSL
jgi:hypothetical protein